MASSLKMKQNAYNTLLKVTDVLAELLALRSGLSRDDSEEAWLATIKLVASRVAKELRHHHSDNIKPSTRKRIAKELQEIAKTPRKALCVNLNPYNGD